VLGAAGWSGLRAAILQPGHLAQKDAGESRVWWRTPVIPALRRLRQEDLEFEILCTLPGVHSETLSLKEKKRKKTPQSRLALPT
jgi:hypothetical protein